MSATATVLTHVAHPSTTVSTKPRLAGFDVDGTRSGTPSINPGLCLANEFLVNELGAIGMPYGDVTGRPHEEYCERLREYSPIDPDFAALDMGTEVRWRNKGALVKDADFDERLRRENPHWDKSSILSDVAIILPGAGITYYVANNLDNPFRISLMMDAGNEEVAHRCISRALEHLASNIKVIKSVAPDRDHKARGWIDIVPAHGGKSFTLQHVGEKLFGESSEPHHYVHAGDSGNDFCAFKPPHAYALVVGNARDQVKEDARALKLGHEGKLHIARRTFVGAIIEGFEGWGIFTPGTYERYARAAQQAGFTPL